MLTIQNNIDMNKITILAAIKTFYDSGKDLIEVFASLVLQILEANKKESIDTIQIKIKTKYNLNLPLDVLITIVKRLKKNSLVEYQDINTATIIMNLNGERRQNSIEEGLRTKERDNNALIEDIKLYLKNKKNEDFENQNILDALKLFIEESAQEATLILSNGVSANSKPKKGLKKYIADFFLDSEHSDPINFERLKSILYGEIIANSLLNSNIEINAKFKKLNIYLDTNIVFSLLGFHEEAFNKPTKELINIVKELGINLKIFNFTKDEIVSTLKNYLDQEQYYSAMIKVNSIYHVLKRKNYSKSDIISIIENIDEKLNKMNIEIDYSIDIKQILENQTELIDKLQEYKPDKFNNSINHDLAAILSIKKLRGNNNSYLIEKSREIFLSADFRLAMFDNKEICKNLNHTIPEVILRNQLTAILWLKKVKDEDNTFIHNFLASQLHEDFINLSLWEKFISELKIQQEKGMISYEDIDLLMSLNETEIILKEKKEAGITEILNDGRIKKKKEELIEKDNKMKEDSETINRQLESIQRIAKKIEEGCKKKWKLIIDIFCIVICTGIIILFLFCICKLENGIKDFADYASLVIIFWIIVGLISLLTKNEFKINGFLVKFRIAFENRQIQKCIIKKKKKIDFHF